MQVLFYKITKKCGRIRRKWAFSGKFVRNT